MPRTLDYPRRDVAAPDEDQRLRNWAGNASLAAPGSIVTPADEDDLRRRLAASDGPIRVIGSRMSPGRLLEVGTAGGTLLDLGRFRGLLALDDDTATFAAATPLADVYAELTARGRMLPASPGVIDAQTLGGALATGTHGQGLGQSTIADAALRIRLVLADGEVLELDRSHPWFPAAQLGLGVLGAVTEVTLRTVPSLVYTCRKTAESDAHLETDLVAWNRDNVLTKAWWFPDDDRVHLWAAREAEPDEVRRYTDGGRELLVRDEVSDALNDTVASTLTRMRDDTKIVDADGRPFRTVTRFADFSDVTGDVYQVFCRGIATPQINVEIGVPLARAGEAVAAIREWHRRTRPHLHYPVILRSTGSSSAWLSPAYGQETCFFGFVVYYAADGSLAEPGLAFLSEVERILRRFGGRPHWGKYFDDRLYDWPALYPRWRSFSTVRRTLDPRGRFSNTFTTALFGDALRTAA